jgi:hypothetical protein
MLCAAGTVWAVYDALWYEPVYVYMLCVHVWLAGEDVSLYEMKIEVCEEHVWEGKYGAWMAQWWEST